MLTCTAITAIVMTVGIHWERITEIQHKFDWQGLIHCTQLINAHVNKPILLGVQQMALLLAWYGRDLYKEPSLRFLRNENFYKHLGDPALRRMVTRLLENEWSSVIDSRLESLKP